jgi:hypothetical protein
MVFVIVGMFFCFWFVLFSGFKNWGIVSVLDFEFWVLLISEFGNPPPSGGMVGSAPLYDFMVMKSDAEVWTGI